MKDYQSLLSDKLDYIRMVEARLFELIFQEMTEKDFSVRKVLQKEISSLQKIYVYTCI